MLNHKGTSILEIDKNIKILLKDGREIHGRTKQK